MYFSHSLVHFLAVFLQFSTKLSLAAIFIYKWIKTQKSLFIVSNIMVQLSESQ